MQVELARYGDVKALAQFCRRHHEKNDWNFLPFSTTKVRESLVEMIRTDGMDVIVARDDESGEICGMLLAGLDQFFMNKQWYATDVHFVADRGGRAILRRFFQWAQEHGAKMVVMGIATDDPDGRIAGFYKAMGMEQLGAAWVKRFHVEQEQAA